MHTLKLTARIDEDGHLRLDIPTQLAASDVDVVIVLQPTQPTTSQKPSQQRYDFSDLVGKLQWQGDALAVQRMLRDEW